MGYNIFGEMNSDIQSDDTFDNSSKQVSSEWYERYPDLMDGGFLMVMVFVWLGVIISSLLIDTNPIFLVISIVLFTFLLILAIMMGNVWQETMTDAELAGMETSFPVMFWVYDNLLIMVVGVVSSIMISLYAKSKL